MRFVRKKPIGIVMLTIFTIALGGGYFFGAVMFTPSLPAITSYFDTNSSLARMTVSSFFIMMSLSQLIYGPASDKYGRKPFILIGGIIFACGSIFCILSQSIIFLILGRAIQGLGAGALITLARTLVQDSFTKEHFLKAIAWMSIFFAVAPAISPLIGGVLQFHFGWHSSFIFMLIFAITLIISVIFLLPETNKNKNPSAMNIKYLANNYLIIAKTRMFWVYLIFIITGLSGGICFDVIGSFVLINDYQLTSAAFGVISTMLLMMIIISRFLTSMLLLKYMEKENVILLGLFMMFCSSIVLVILDFLKLIGLIDLIIVLAIFFLAAGIVTPISVANLLSLFDNMKGFASAFFGSMQMSGIFLVSIIASSMSPSIGFMVSILCVLSFISLIIGVNVLYKNSHIFVLKYN
ncbi:MULTISPECIES: Bcr/CflA family efflux MFS transporter [unclassified Francisella]|uniref:Bcr/CflA family efflux MFS transporter n=1 Tax=unclassified Francisella TaxID=2610885 RepID=UPI002E3479DE|nr:MULTISPECIES: Bcr/CflA family efflux MFS transporter [unclassified Francisella]MED7819364.1 Bcr/CflA family efflux MFS transporter [Francisella sp. 19S2-4]MED7830179.1 Bcr/CflA family efflux MFS transporter [Francisella sp. 19S2-10]